MKYFSTIEGRLCGERGRYAGGGGERGRYAGGGGERGRYAGSFTFTFTFTFGEGAVRRIYMKERPTESRG